MAIDWLLFETLLVGRVGADARLYLDSQVADVVDELAPELAPLPPAVVGRIRAKHEERAEDQTQKAMKLCADAGFHPQPPTVRKHDRGGIQRHAGAGFPQP